MDSGCELKLLVTAPAGDATVTISHRYTPKEQLKQHTIRADIVVAAAGKSRPREHSRHRAAAHRVLLRGILARRS